MLPVGSELRRIRGAAQAEDWDRSGWCFEEEATRTDVVSALTGLAALAAPDRTAKEHTDVARFVIDFLLNRQAHHAKFTSLHRRGFA